MEDRLSVLDRRNFSPSILLYPFHGEKEPTSESRRLTGIPCIPLKSLKERKKERKKGKKGNATQLNNLDGRTRRERLQKCHHMWARDVIRKVNWRPHPRTRSSISFSVSCIYVCHEARVLSHWGHACLCRRMQRPKRLTHSTGIKTQQTSGEKERRRRWARSGVSVVWKRREDGTGGWNHRQGGVQGAEVTKKREKPRGLARVTSRAEGIQIEERSMTLEICIAINNEAGVRSPSYRASNCTAVQAFTMCTTCTGCVRTPAIRATYARHDRHACIVRVVKQCDVLLWRHGTPGSFCGTRENEWENARVDATRVCTSYGRD